MFFFTKVGEQKCIYSLVKLWKKRVFFVKKKDVSGKYTEKSVFFDKKRVFFGKNKGGFRKAYAKNVFFCEKKVRFLSKKEEVSGT